MDADCLAAEIILKLTRNKQSIQFSSDVADECIKKN